MVDWLLRVIPRCSLFGKDVNRTYIDPSDECFPEVYHTKRVVEELQGVCRDVVFCDLHGHSRAFNAFIYGCDSGYRSYPPGLSVRPPKTYLTNPEQYLVDRMIPFLIGQEVIQEYFIELGNYLTLIANRGNK